MSKLKNIGLSPAKILLPKDNFEKWAVVACDQYTSEPEYWKRVDEFVGETPSARITSYNVCYTKLLRRLSKSTSGAVKIRGSFFVGCSNSMDFE